MSDAFRMMGRGAGPPPGPLPQTFRDRMGALRNLPPFLRLVWRTNRGLTIATLALRLVRALLPVATLYVAKLIIDQVVHLTQLTDRPDTLSGWLQSGDLSELWFLFGAEFALAVLNDALGRLVGLVDSLLSEQFSNSISIRLMEHAARLDLEDFEDAEFQDQLDRARRQTQGRTTLISQIFSQAQNTLTAISFGAGLVAFAPWLIVLLIVALVPAFIGESHFNAQGYAIAYARAAQRRELDYIRQTGASVETAKEVKIFGIAGFLIDRYRELATSIYDANRELAKRRAFWGGLLTSLGTVGYYLAYLYLAWQTLTGRFSIGDLTFLSASFLRLRQLIEGLLSSFSDVASQALFLQDLFAFFEIAPEIVTAAKPLPFPKPIREGFVFEDVGFIYPGAERWAVRHLDFTLHAGEVLALVGENGAGKTTLVKLLARLYDPDEGRILLDGHDLRDYDLDQLRSNVGVIFQDFVRYALSAADNIAIGRIEGRADRPRIQRAAERSMASEVIEHLPKGYDQMIGRRFQGGVDLSGGEWQKVAIARAYMREAQVLILDEPTAALDARSEYGVFERFRELSEDRTVVLISHRFSSVRMADRILVMADGGIEASGTHEQLLAQGGRYAELFELQAAGYR